MPASDAQIVDPDPEEGEEAATDEDDGDGDDEAREHAGAADFRTGAGGGWYRDDRRNACCVSAGPPVADILEIPDRPLLARHEGDGFSEVEAGTAAKGDDAVMSAVTKRLDAGIEVLLVRVRIDIGEDCAAETGSLENIERVLRNRHGGQATIGNEERFRDADGFAGISQFPDAACAEFDGSRIGPVGNEVHAFAFLR